MSACPPCVDTHILIWAVQGRTSPGQEAMVGLVQRFLRQAERPPIAPAIAVHEMLIRADQPERARWAVLVEELFQVQPFDLAAAVEAATIEATWRQRLPRTPVDPAQDVAIRRERLRADIQIIATAVVSGAACLYSHDPHVTRLAEGFIDVRKLAVQGELDLDA